MIRCACILMGCLMAGMTASADVLTTTRLYPEAWVDRSQPLELDLGDFFQVFPNPGPIASFTFRLPEQTGVKQLKIDFEQDAFQNPIYDNDGRFIPIYDGSRTANIMTYKLLSGQEYDHFYAVAPEDFVWNDHFVQFQLLADVAPVTVTNFMTYVKSGAYTDTVIHRSEIDVLQGGGWIHNVAGGFVLDTIDTYDPIPLERTWTNLEGTIAMARQSAENSATSQFFINVANNTNGFSDNYAVFGDLLGKGVTLPLLKQMQDVTAWNYGGAFAALPLYSGYLEDVESWVHFNSVSVTEGETAGIAHQWTFIDPNGDGSLSARELAFQAAFDISIDNGILRIARNDSGEARIRLSGSFGGQNRSIEIDLVGYSEDALRAFPGSVIHAEGFIDNPWYGWLVADGFPYIQHLNHGYQYVNASLSEFLDDNDYYIFDFTMGTWLYSKADFYPYLFDYSRNAWVWYVEGTGNGDSEKRWFFNFNTGEWFQD
jgi:cyclophilin family peptidyl-prolyl cis-trans isomerase